MHFHHGPSLPMFVPTPIFVPQAPGTDLITVAAGVAGVVALTAQTGTASYSSPTAGVVTLTDPGPNPPFSAPVGGVVTITDEEPM